MAAGDGRFRLWYVCAVKVEEGLGFGRYTRLVEESLVRRRQRYIPSDTVRSTRGNVES